jgi:hypothetical protein
MVGINDKKNIYSGYFTLLSPDQGKDDFSSRYKKFKKIARCKNVKQVVQISERHLKNEKDVSELERIAEGLRNLKDHFGVTVSADSPMRMILKYLFPNLFIQKEEHLISSLDSTIKAYERKIALLNTEETGEGIENSSKIIDALEERLQEIQLSNDDKYDYVKELLDNPQFCADADSALKSLVNIGELPAKEVFVFWSREIRGLKQYLQANGTEISAKDVRLAMMLAGKSHMPLFIQRMDKLRQREPGVMSSLLAGESLKRECHIFNILAASVGLAVGDQMAQQLDLTKQSYQEAYMRNFSAAEEGLDVEITNGVLEKEVLALWGKVVSAHSSLSAEGTLNVLSEGMKEIVRAVFSQNTRFDDGIRMESPNGEDIAQVGEELVLILGSIGKNHLSALAIVMENVLSDVDISELDDHTFKAVMGMIAAFKKYSGIDLSEAVVKQARIKRDAIALMMQLMDKGHQAAKEEILVKSEGKLEKYERMIDFSEKPELKNEANKFFNNALLRAKTGDSDALERIDLHFSECMRNMHELIQKGDHPFGIDYLSGLQWVIYTAYEDSAEQAAELAFHLARLVQDHPRMIETEFFKAVCHAMDFACGIDPSNILSMDAFASKVRRGVPGAVSDPAYAVRIRKNIQKSLDRDRQLALMDAKSPPQGVNVIEIKTAKKICALLDKPDFKEDAKKLFCGLLDEGPFGGTHSKRRILGQNFSELQDKYKDIFGLQAVYQFGEDENTMLRQACLAAAQEEVPDVFKLFEGMDEDIISRPESLNDFHMFGFYTIKSIYENDQVFEPVDPVEDQTPV